MLCSVPYDKVGCADLSFVCLGRAMDGRKLMPITKDPSFASTHRFFCLRNTILKKEQLYLLHLLYQLHRCREKQISLMLVERITSITGQSALSFRSITTITVAMLALAATSSSRRGALAFHTRCSVAGLTRSAQNRSFPNVIGSATARRTNLPAMHLSAGLHSTSSTAHSFRYDIRLMSSVSHSEEDYNSLKVAELRDVLRERGLAISGTKAQLVERLGMSDGKSSTPKINAKRMPNNLVFEEEGPDEYSVVNDQKDDVKQSSRTAKTTFDPNVTPEVVPASSRSFKEDFQGTRVFVQGLPKEATWQDVRLDYFVLFGTPQYSFFPM